MPQKGSPRAELNRPYLYWHPMGRLGNIIFEHATAFCIAVQSNHTPTVRDNSALLKLFQLSHVVKLTKEQWINESQPKVYEYQCCFHQPHVLEKTRNMSGEVLLRGYFHSYKYMLPCWEEIRQELRLQKAIQDKAIHHMVRGLLGYYVNSTEPRIKRDTNYNNVLKTLQSGRLPTETSTFIGVHIRRTDRHATYAPISFFQKAFRHFESQFKNVVFFVCSDDITWGKQKLPTLVSNNSAIVFMSDLTLSYMVDFGVLVNCNHSIITAGTFSWWSGWLAGGQVVYHTGYDRWKKEVAPMTYKQEDFFPDNWIPMD